MTTICRPIREFRRIVERGDVKKDATTERYRIDVTDKIEGVFILIRRS